MNCRKCAKPLPEGAAFCPWCGTKQATAPQRSRTRPNGAGTAIRRGKTYTARVIVRWAPVPDSDPPRKKAIYRTKGGFKTRREALEYCAVLKGQDYKPKVDAPRLAEYWEMYEKGELMEITRQKQSGYRTAWKKLKPLENRPVDQITVAELRETVGAATSTYYTARDCKTVLTKLFALAGADGWVSKDLPSYIILPKLNEKERQTFSDTEQLQLWKLYEAGDLRAAVPLLMICTGMMPGEMQGLRVEHIDLDAHQIRGAGMKTKIRRESPVYLPEDVLPMVEDLIAHAQPSGYLWKRNEEAWYQNYYDVLAAAGCRRLEPYCCRHTTATRLAVTENIAPQTIRRMMRWTTTKMLDRYAHPDDADVIEAANTLKRQ